MAGRGGHQSEAGRTGAGKGGSGALPLPFRRLLRRPEAAAYGGISAGLFDQMVADGRMPRPRVVNSLKLWDLRDLDAAIDALPVQGGDPAEKSSWDDL